jgi:RecA-family ATPase
MRAVEEKEAPTAAKGNGQYQETLFTKLNSHALANLDEWVPELFPQATKRPGDKGWRVSSASLGRDLEEDISFAPNGIKDFGVWDIGDEREGKRTPIDIVIQAKQCDLQDAVEWLDERLPPPALPDIDSWTLPYIDMRGWGQISPPARDWAVEGLIPMNQPHLTTGHGAIGKSLLELMRAVAHVLGKPWLGMDVKQGPVIYLSCEEEADEFERRLTAILDHYGAYFADIIGKLYIVTYAGAENCLLATSDLKGVVKKTPLYDKLLAEALRLKPVAIFIDTLTDVYAGNEIDRSQVTQFIKLLQSLAMQAKCSVSILAHPSVEGMRSGSGISGSTGWHNKVRSRMYLRAPENKKGEEIDSNLREVVFMKNNYGKQGEKLVIRWEKGVFVREQEAGSMDLAIRNQEDDEKFLERLDQLEARGQYVSPKPRANNYAPTLFAKNLLQSANIGKERFEAAMNRLLENRKIRIVIYGPASKPAERIVREAQP